MSPKRETQAIVIGTVVGLCIIVSGYFGLQNQLFPPGTQESLKAFEKMVNEPDPFWDSYRLARVHLEKGEYNLAVEECNKAMEAAKTNLDVYSIHRQLLEIYEVMGDVGKVQQELEWLANDMAEVGNDEKRLEYRRRLEELKQSQQLAPAATARTEDLGEVR